MLRAFLSQLWRVAFVLEAEGKESYAQCFKKLGSSPSTLFLIENCEKSVTLGRLGQIMTKLKESLADISGESI